MNIAVVDEEEIIRQQIHGFIKKQKPASEISDFSTGEELLAAGREFEILLASLSVKCFGMEERHGYKNERRSEDGFWSDR